MHIKSQDTCHYHYEKNFFRNQQLCASFPREASFNVLGSTVSIDNKIIGFTTSTHRWTTNDTVLVLNVVAFSNWISQKMNTPIKQFTSPASNNNHDSKRAIDLYDIRNKALQENLDALESKFTDKNQIVEKQLKDLVGKLDIYALKFEKSNVALQMTIDDNSNTAQENRLEEIKKALDKQNIKINETGLNNENSVERQFQIHMSNENKVKIELQEKVDKLVSVIYKNYIEENLHFEEIKKSLSEQEMNMDKHLIHEIAPFNSSWAEIKTLNESAIQILRFIYEDALSK